MCYLSMIAAVVLFVSLKYISHFALAVWIIAGSTFLATAWILLYFAFLYSERKVEHWKEAQALLTPSSRRRTGTVIRTCQGFPSDLVVSANPAYASTVGGGSDCKIKIPLPPNPYDVPVSRSEYDPPFAIPRLQVRTPRFPPPTFSPPPPPSPASSSDF
nr:hypothetical protein [Tawny frogmouth aviadenovirus A]